MLKNTFKGAGSTQTAALVNFAFPFTAPALPQASNQTLRMIVKPDIWGSVMRVRLSNKWGTGPVTFGSVSIGLQSFSGATVAGSNTRVLFGGSRSVTVKKGDQIFSDEVRVRTSSLKNWSPFFTVTDRDPPNRTRVFDPATVAPENDCSPMLTLPNVTGPVPHLFERRTRMTLPQMSGLTIIRRV